jgi:hypothetical protein
MVQAEGHLGHPARVILGKDIERTNRSPLGSMYTNETGARGTFLTAESPIAGKSPAFNIIRKWKSMHRNAQQTVRNFASVRMILFWGPIKFPLDWK